MSYFDVINILLALLFILFMMIIFKIFFGKIYPNKIIDGCYYDNCKAPRCVGYDCECKSCIGKECEAGYCVGENCKAGNCVGTGCIAGNCYGYGCKPGICIDPLCPYASCPQTNKQCTDGKALRIENSFFLKNKSYFPQNTTLNPPLCNSQITMNDILIGRADGLDINKMYFDNKIFENTKKVNKIDDKKVVINIDKNQGIFKNLNCELCKKTDNNINCRKYSPSIDKNGKIVWK